MVTKVTASTCVFSVPFVLTCRSGNRRVSFHPWSQQQANEALRHDPPKFHQTDHDILAGLFFLSVRFDRLEQSLGGQPQRLSYPSSPTAVQFRRDAQEAFCQFAFAGP
jgi:hypothetical protein